MKLYMGNFNYSSWSLRPWVLARLCDVPLEDEVIPLFEEGSAARIANVSPSGKVPCLHDGHTVVWESMAIMEYLADRYRDRGMMPDDPSARAAMRSVCCEMHAGFQAVRSDLPMNVRARKTPPPLSDALRAEIARIDRIWTQCRATFASEGPFLFGRPSLADAMYAPVVTRFRTFGITLSEPAQHYAETMLTTDTMAEWDARAAAEPWALAVIDAIGEDRISA